jgi:NitT/TauT family transport system ATP-binding protein
MISELAMNLPETVKMAIRDASKFYQTRSGGVHALDTCRSTCGKASSSASSAPRACGKTTLLWSMAGLMR